MTRFSKIATRRLKKAGWYEGRQRDVANDIKALIEKGYPVFPSVVTFLEEFGELHIPHGVGANLEDEGGWICSFDTPEIVERINPDRISEYAAELGKLLCLIGDVDDGITMVFRDEAGVVYETIDGLFLTGNSVDEALETILTNSFRSPAL